MCKITIFLVYTLWVLVHVASVKVATNVYYDNV